MKSYKSIASLVGLALVGLLMLAFYTWSSVRIYVPEGESVMLRYKGPLLGSAKPAAAGEFARPGEIGVLPDLLGPGRHWYWNIWWERTRVEDQLVLPGQVAIVTSKMGVPLRDGEFLVDGNLGETQHKGILRKAYGPGRYRYHPYAYEFKIITSNVTQVGNQQKHSGWVEVPTGYVGVVTNLAAIPAARQSTGIQDHVLPPGLYPINPYEQQIDIVEIGFRETSITTEHLVDGQGNPSDDPSGEPLAVKDSGITFPSNDGFPIQLDFTAIWGVLPAQAPQVVRTFGNIAAVERKVIEPQSESICRNNGSRMGAIELLVGDTRQQFQDDVSLEFQKVLEEKDVTLLYGLVRHIYIPQEIRVPIQQGYIADELKLTREQEVITAVTEANLREAEKRVELEGEKIRVETAKKVASVLAEGEKQSKEIDAEAEQLVATVDLQAALKDAERKVELGRATAKADQLQQEAKAAKFQLAVQAFGSGDAYNKWQFAQGLPADIDLKLFYAGEGTLWTDLKNMVPTLPIRTTSVPDKK